MGRRQRYQAPRPQESPSGLRPVNGHPGPVHEPGPVNRNQHAAPGSHRRRLNPVNPQRPRRPIRQGKRSGIAAVRHGHRRPQSGGARFQPHILPGQRADEQYPQPGRRPQRPSSRRQRRHGPFRHRPQQPPERDRPAGGGGEQQRSRRRLPHPHQQQRRHQRDLKQQWHVDQHAQSSRNRDPLHIVAQIPPHRFGADPLDRQCAAEPRQNHNRRQPHRIPQAGPNPSPQPSNQHRPPRRIIPRANHPPIRGRGNPNHPPARNRRDTPNHSIPGAIPPAPRNGRNIPSIYSLPLGGRVRVGAVGAQLRRAHPGQIQGIAPPPGKPGYQRPQ